MGASAQKHAPGARAACAGSKGGTKRRNNLLAHPRLNLAASFACAASVIAVGLLSLALERAGMTQRTAFVLAAVPSVMCGWLLVDALIIRKMHRTSERIGRLRRQLRLYANVTTRDLFDKLLVKTNDDLGELSRDIHAALTAAHQDRLESARLQRDFTHRLQRETQKATHHLTRMSLTDELTGLGNRRAFDEALASMFREARQQAHDLCCVSFDLDNFKRLNDTHGHAAGDTVLGALGEVLAGSIRQVDFAARLGGDEFVVLLADCDADNAASLCERISRLFGQHPQIARFAPNRPTLSFGISSLREQGPKDPEELLAASDRAMYSAKQAARNRGAA